MSKVIIENVFKIYPGEKGREIIAVENANLTVESEEFMVFVGPSTHKKEAGEIDVEKWQVASPLIV